MGCFFRSHLSRPCMGVCHGTPTLASKPARTHRQDGPAIQACPWETAQQQPRTQRSALQALARHLWRAYPRGDRSERLWLGSGDAGGGHAAICGSTGLSLFWPDADLHRHRWLSRHFAAYLQARLGVKKGDRIAVMLPNIPAFPIAMLGIVRAGAAQVSVNPLYTPRELEHQLNDAGVEIIVIFSGVSASLAEIIGKTAIKQVICVGLGDGTAATLASPPVDARLTSTVAFSDALAGGAELAFAPVALRADDLLFLQYTGGTTGLSKGAALSHKIGRASGR